MWNLLLPGLLLAAVHNSYLTKVQETKSELDLKINSEMLHHDLHWKSTNNSNRFTVSWKILYERFWTIVPKCANINKTSCDLSSILPHSALTYKLRVTSNNGDSENITFCPEFDTKLLPPTFSVTRRENVIFLRPATVMNLGTGEPLENQLMTLSYQVKIWPRHDKTASNITQLSLLHSEIHVTVPDNQKEYCVTMRLYDEDYSTLNKTSGSSPWGREQCVEAGETNAFNQTLFLASVLPIVGLTLVSAGVFLAFRAWNVRRRLKTQQSAFIQMIDDVLVNETDCTAIHIPSRRDSTSDLMGAAPLETRDKYEAYNINETIQSLQEIKFLDGVQKELCVDRTRSESGGYCSGSSVNAPTTSDSLCDVFAQYDDADYLPADAVFLDDNLNPDFEYVSDCQIARSSSFSGFRDELSLTSQHGSLTSVEQEYKGPPISKYIMYESQSNNNLSSPHKSYVSLNDDEQYEEFPGLNPTYSAEIYQP